MSQAVLGKKNISFQPGHCGSWGKFTTYLFEDFHKSCKLSKTLIAARWRRPARNETNIFLTNFMEEFQRLQGQMWEKMNGKYLAEIFKWKNSSFYVFSDDVVCVCAIIFP